MDRHVNEVLSTLRDFLAGRSNELSLPEGTDIATHQLLAQELLAAMSCDKPESQEEQSRARKLFMDQGYFDETVQHLRGAIVPQERAAAARALGVVGSQRGTPHLIAAMFDDDPAVRNAAEKALAQMSGPAVSAASEAAPLDLPESKAAARFTFSQDAVFRTDEPEAANRPAQDAGVVAHQSKPELPRETSPESTQPATTNGPETAKDPDQLLLEEQASREMLKQLDRQLLGAASVRTELEKEATLSIARESRLRAEATARRREEEELRKQADDEAERRRSQEREALAAEQAARDRGEAEAQRIAEDEARMRLETSNLRRVADELAWQRIGIETARREAAEADRRAQARSSREEAERRHHAELAQLRNEEVILHTATGEATRRRVEVETAHQDTKAEIERLTQERVQLAAAEAFRHAEATRLRLEAKTRHEAEVTRLSSEEESLRAVAEQVARQRAEVRVIHQAAEAEIERLNKERAQLAAAEAARRAETERIRQTEERNRADAEQLRLELEGLRLVTEEVATRRAEVESARKKADEEAERLLEVQARMRAEAEASARAEAERVQLEAELHERVEMQHSLLGETRRRAQEEQQRLEDEARRQSEHEEQRQAELKLLQEGATTMAQQRSDEEKQIRGQVDSLRIADAEARKRIEEAETRRRKSEDVYRLVAEKVQRVEAEAHLRALEEEKILAKLEAVRRSAAVEAQARADQEKRIKDEIELFRKLEEVERPRLEVAALQKTQAQGLFEQRERSKTDEDTRGRVEDSTGRSDAQFQPDQFGDHGGHSLTEPERPIESAEVARSFSNGGANLVSPAASEAYPTDEDRLASAGTPTIDMYLNSTDPYKRAAAVTELARSNAPDSFEVIAKCFDDHSPHVRNAAARGLLKINPARTVELFNRILEEGTEDRRRKIGSAIASSGLANEAIDNLVGDDREKTYNALSILFVMARSGEVQPLVQAIAENSSTEISEAAIKLLTLSGKSEIASAALKQRANGQGRRQGQ